MVNGVLYLVTPYQSLAAVEPETGKQIWLYSHKHAGRPPRGIAYWPGDRTNPPEILCGTYDGFLMAVDAKTGKPVTSFGTNGEIDLKAGMMNDHPEEHYGLSAAPVIYKDLVMTGIWFASLTSNRVMWAGREFQILRGGAMREVTVSQPRPERLSA